MNDFSEQKLGEAIAFARIGLEFVQRGASDAEEVLGGRKHASNFVEILTAYRDTLEQDASDQTTQQAQVMHEELRGRMERRLDGAWEDQLKMLDWLGEYCNGALNRWAILVGYAEAADINTLAAIAHQAIDFYMTQIEFTKEQLVRIGTEQIDSK